MCQNLFVPPLNSLPFYGRVSKDIFLTSIRELVTSCIIAFAFSYIPRCPAFDLAVNWTINVAPFFFWTWFDSITAETEKLNLIWNCTAKNVLYSKNSKSTHQFVKLLLSQKRTVADRLKKSYRAMAKIRAPELGVLPPPCDQWTLLPGNSWWTLVKKKKTPSVKILGHKH